MDESSTADLVAFLLEAKRRTYAGLDDDATVAVPLLAGSKQLEYCRDGMSYRDIYFGMSYFVGQEVVTANERPVWSMSYAGGTQPEITARDEVLTTYGFLRKALLRVSGDRPFRGPAQFDEGIFRYVNTSDGAFSAFRGSEEILREGKRVYALHYSGGMLR
jgi:hypothetical protein